ncbi:hypothetical protein [Nocardia sp. NPDC057030]
MTVSIEGDALRRYAGIVQFVALLADCLIDGAGRSWRPASK